MVAGNEHHPGAASHLAQQFLDDVVMRLRPVPAGAEAPAIDDVSDKVDSVGLHIPQHIQNKMGLAAARAQMQIRQEQRPVSLALLRLGHRGPPREGANNEK